MNNHLPKGIHFNPGGRIENFPPPDRELVYGAYPEFRISPIKSVMASVGCPFSCTYCYAHSFNQMHGGFVLATRPVYDVIEEVLFILNHWPLTMVYFQDDIFGYHIRWLEEFVRSWKSNIGIPFHCQIRLELTRGKTGDRRLDLFAEAGCSGITLAIESGSKFLRDHVLFRQMSDELIIEGCHKIVSRGMKLRTEQILAVPFSDITTDMSTLDLNNRIDPTMAWTSILVPYSGTDIGTIVKNFGLYAGDNDDLRETFFDSSVLRHVDGGPRDVEEIITRQELKTKNRPLLAMRTVPQDNLSADVLLDGKHAGNIRYLSTEQNKCYCRSVVRLQRLFMWMVKIPDASMLAKRLLGISEDEWCWKNIGDIVEQHLSSYVDKKQLCSWKLRLAEEMSCNVDNIPTRIADNPWYFVFFPEGGVLARKAIEQSVFEEQNIEDSLDSLTTLTRRHLFHYGLYKIEVGRDPIAK